MTTMEGASGLREVALAPFRANQMQWWADVGCAG